MSAHEYMRWQQFYLQNPFDDLHRYHRPAAFVAANMSGADIKKSLDFLVNRQVDDAQGLSDVDLSILNLFSTPTEE